MLALLTETCGMGATVKTKRQWIFTKFSFTTT